MRSLARSHLARWAAAAIAVTTLLALASSAQAGSLRAASLETAGAPARTAAVGASSPSDTGASDISNLGSAGWAVQSSAVATQSGAQISTPGFNTSTWLPVTNDDAGAPGTEIQALAQAGKCPGDTALQPANESTDRPNTVLFSANMRASYGFLTAVAPHTGGQFSGR